MKTDKEFRCTVCNQAFSRSDHLKRHHLRRMQNTPELFQFKAKPRQIPARSHTSVNFAMKHLHDG
jgi:hypothetical protein